MATRNHNAAAGAPQLQQNRAPMSMSLRERIRKRRDDEDDDMMLFLFPALSLLDSSSVGEKKPRHAFDEPGEIKVRRLLEGHVKNCWTHFRMEPEIFKALANYLRNNRIVRDSRIKVEEKLGFLLYMLSHNASFEDLQITFHYSNDTFHHHISHFFNKALSSDDAVLFRLVIGDVQGQERLKLDVV